jgi:2-polyprenyl-3-methyl-5-hydroxy-6-metoxy-1,4-benzoquinol methylase
MKNDRQIWDDIWKEIKANISEDKLMVQREISSIRWQKIEKRVIDKYHSFNGLDVIEIGAGRGENSLLMSLRGANVTLLDYSETALEKAKLLFSNFNCKAQFIKADALNIPPNLLNKFDVSMSFGLAEHFTYPQRQQIINSHYILLKQGGLSFISVPNAFCFPYRLAQMALRLFHKFQLLEIPFTRSELRKIAHSIGYQPYEIVGSSFFTAIDEFLIRNAMHFVAKRIGIKSSLKRSDNIKEEKETIFDDYLGYSLILIGYK